MIYTSRVSAFLFCLRKETPAKKRQTRGFTPRPRQRRAAVHSSWLSVGSSAHSLANAPELERMRASASCFASRSALSKHSRLSPLERALCSLFFANIASLYPPLAVLRRRCPRSQIACSTAARLLETCSTGFIKSLALLFEILQRFTNYNVTQPVRSLAQFCIGAPMPDSLKGCRYEVRLKNPAYLSYTVTVLQML